MPISISFGNLSVGEQTDDIRLDINNTGNVAIRVTPKLANSSERIFNNTYFKRITSEPYYRIGNYTHDISAPTINGVKSSYMYVKLDLRDYSGSFDKGSVNDVKADIKFYAVAQ